MDVSLHAARPTDLPRLTALLTLPPVYEFLSDGVPPSRDVVEGWISAAVDGGPPFGLWLLEDAFGGAAGCVRLSPVADGAASAELTYLVHPDAWGRGLATAMSRSAIARAFETPSCESILAGADVANARSVRVMQRLGMRLLREVTYPAGPGVEYVVSRAEFTPGPRGRTIPFA